jgi:nucleoid-associated protein YgaU
MTAPVPGLLKRKDNSDTLTFHYNPTTVSLTKMVMWKNKAQRNARTTPDQEYTGTRPSTLTMQLLFDAIDDSKRRVPDAVQKLLEWSAPTEQSRSNQRPQPPALLLQWGTEPFFPCRLKRLKIKYTLFDRIGIPIRAKVDVTLVELPDEPAGTNPTSGGVSGRKSVQVGAGDSLPSLAYQEYGNPNLWRALAEANGIDDPLRLRPGDHLLIPPRPDAAKLAGGSHV